MTVVCPLCGTSYASVMRKPGDRCGDLSLVDLDEAYEDTGCVGRVIPEHEYALIDEQARVRRLATRRDLANRPLLRRTF